MPQSDKPTRQIQVVIGFAVLPQRYVGIESVLESLSENLSGLAMDGGWFDKRALASLTLALSCCDGPLSASLGRSYVGHSKNTPRININVKHSNLLKHAGNEGALYAYLSSACLFGLTYAAKKLRLKPLTKSEGPGEA